MQCHRCCLCRLKQLILKLFAPDCTRTDSQEKAFGLAQRLRAPQLFFGICVYVHYPKSWEGHPIFNILSEYFGSIMKN